MGEAAFFVYVPGSERITLRTGDTQGGICKAAQRQNGVSRPIGTERIPAEPDLGYTSEGRRFLYESTASPCGNEAVFCFVLKSIAG